MTPEQVDALHRISMGIFVDCVNVGVPFQDALVAIYLSGLNHGSAAARPERDEVSERG